MLGVPRFKLRTLAVWPVIPSKMPSTLESTDDEPVEDPMWCRVFALACWASAAAEADVGGWTEVGDKLFALLRVGKEKVRRARALRDAVLGRTGVVLVLYFGIGVVGSVEFVGLGVTRVIDTSPSFKSFSCPSLLRRSCR